jgi:hypothetical protein
MHIIKNKIRQDFVVDLFQFLAQKIIKLRTSAGICTHHLMSMNQGEYQ